MRRSICKAALSVALPNEMRSATWHFRHRQGSSDQLTLTPVYTVNNALMVRLATLAGMGFSILPEGLVAADLEAGTLERILPDYTIDDPDMKVSIVYPGRQYLPAKTRLFIDYALEKLAPQVNAENRPPGCAVDAGAGLHGLHRRGHVACLVARGKATH